MSRKDDLISQRRRMQTEAVNHALRGEWDKAIEINEEMYRRDNQDVETLNRLAKAYFESGDVDAAKRSYQRVLELNELNPIAKRALAAIDRAGAVLKQQREYVDMRNFVIETGKSILTTIHVDLPEPVSLLPGEVVYLRIPGKPTSNDAKAAKKTKKTKKDAVEDEPTTATDQLPISKMYAISSVHYTPATIAEDANAIDIYNIDGQLIGRLEPRIAQRIIRFMREGHCYAAIVWRVSEHFHHVDLVIREIYHNPDYRGEVSFPGKLIDEDKAPLLDLADDEIEEGALDSGYDDQEELPRLSAYDDDDDTFEGGDDSSDESDEIDEFPGAKKPKTRAGAAAKQTYGEKEVSLSELAQDEAKGEDVEEE